MVIKGKQQFDSGSLDHKKEKGKFHHALRGVKRGVTYHRYITGNCDRL